LWDFSVRRIKVTRILLVILFVSISSMGVWAVPDIVDVSPTAPYDRFTIFESLAFFWVAVIGVVVFLRM
jgi:hypothetical protein